MPHKEIKLAAASPQGHGNHQVSIRIKTTLAIATYRDTGNLLTKY